MNTVVCGAVRQLRCFRYANRKVTAGGGDKHIAYAIFYEGGNYVAYLSCRAAFESACFAIKGRPLADRRVYSQVRRAFFKSRYFKACNVFHIGKGKVVKTITSSILPKSSGDIKLLSSESMAFSWLRHLTCCLKSPRSWFRQAFSRRYSRSLLLGHWRKKLSCQQSR